MSSKRSQNTFINNTLATQIVFIAAIAAIVLLFERFSDKESPLAIDLAENEAALFIDFDNMKRVFTGEVAEGMTILDTLNASVAAGKIELTYNVDGGNNTKITEINDHRANEDSQFTFYVNSRKLDPSELNKTHIQPGDKITIRLE